MQQNLGQQSKDIAYGDFLRKQNHPQQQIANYSATLHGIPYSATLHGIPAPVTTTSYGQQPGTPHVNTAGNLASLAGQLYGMNKMAGYKKGGRIKSGLGSLPRLARMPQLPSLKRKKPKGVSALSRGGW